MGRPVPATFLFRIIVTGVLIGTSGCGGEGVGVPDGAGDEQTGDDGGGPTPPAPPVPPALTPCPAGWRELGPTEAGDPSTCDPWPSTGRLECPPGQSHFPGEEGCARIGTACPADGWPEGLPSDRPLYFVRAGAPAGGTGARDAPFGRIADARLVARAGSIIVLAAGEYVETVRVGRDVALWGACAEGTTVASPVADAYSGTIEVTGTGAQVRNLRVGGERPGVWVDTTGEVLLEGVWIEGTAALGLAVWGGATVRGRSVIVRGTRGNRDGEFGRGILVQEGSRLELERAVLEGNRDAGVFAAGAGTSIRLLGVAVSDTQEQESDGSWGVGVAVQTEASGEIERSVIERNRRAGVLCRNCSLVLRDAAIRDTRSDLRDGKFGRGLVVEEGGLLEATRLLVEGNRETGVDVRGGAAASFADVVVRDTEATDAAEWGIGMQVFGAAVATLERVALLRNRTVGLSAAGAGTRANLTDILLLDTLAEPAGLAFGRGLTAADGAVVEGRRVRIERSRDLGIGVWGGDTAVRLTDADIRDVLERDCARGGCAGEGGGIGLGCYAGGTARLERFLVTRAAMCGVQLAFGADPATGVRYTEAGTADLLDGEVSGHPIGANLQDPGFDIARLMDRVLWLGNGRNLESETLPVPDTRAPE